MRLIGNYLSPYVRRVAVSLNILGYPFDLEHVFVFDEPDRIRPLNPLTRIPVLVLDDGGLLCESWAILDELDRMAGTDKALIPPENPLRRSAIQITALSLGCAEKAQWAFYERRVRPEEKVHQQWIDHNDRQVLGGFEALENKAGSADRNSWIAGTEEISQADITTSVAFTFAETVRPALDLSRKFPLLKAFANRCEALEAFRRAPLPERNT